MGVATYNRGSAAIRRQIDEDMRGIPVRIAYEPKPMFDTEPLGPKFAPCGYWDLRDDPRMVEVGDRVYCTVSACQGWMTVTAVRYDHRHVDIKTDAFGRSWGYGHNFTFNPPSWMTR